MPKPLVIGYHLIWTAYGWWLPNDPRGSMSHRIRNDVMHELGEIHFGRKEVQPASRVIREFYPRTIKYVEENPTKARLPAQKWDFVKEYDGWPLHPGHHPGSPYAVRLRGNQR